MTFDLNAAIAAIESKFPNVAGVLPKVHEAVTIAEGMVPLLPAIFADVTAASQNPLAFVKVAEDFASAWTTVISPALAANTPAASPDTSADQLNAAQVASGGVGAAVKAMLIAPLVALGLSLSACSPGSLPTITAQPADPNVVTAIGDACSDSGLFKAADGTLTVFVPAATLPVDVINAGVDKVCANPTAFASDVSTAEWVVKATVNSATKSSALRQRRLARL